MTRTRPTVADDLIITLEYTLWDEEGELIDSSEEEGPLVFLQGHGEILEGLEETLYGMGIGEEKEVFLSPEDAYGEYQSDAVQLIPHDAFPSDADLEPGMEIYLEDDESEELIEAYVSEILPEGVLIDFNHPLAGEALRFHVKVVDIRPASPEELEHGHVHSNGHHH